MFIVSRFGVVDRFGDLRSLFLFTFVKVLYSLGVRDRMLVFELRVTKRCVFEEKLASGMAFEVQLLAAS